MHLNYDTVLQLLTTFRSEKQSNNDTNVGGGSITYGELTQREHDAYVNALYRIRNEESITNSKGR